LPKESLVKSHRPARALFAIVFLCSAAADLPLFASDNWPQWRGPTANGISDSKNLPTEWSLEKNQNIVWKAELPSWSGGTPVIWGDRVFVTSPTKANPGETPPPDNRPKGGPGFGGKGPGGFKGPTEGKGFSDKGGFGGKGPPDGKGFGGRGGFGGGKGGGQRRDPGGQTLLLLCLSKKDGSLLWQRDLDTGNRIYNKQNSSSPSPVTDGQTVWVVTGNGVVTAFDMDGNELWKKNMQQAYGNFGLNWGYGSSPLLFDGKLIIEVLHGNNTDDPSYLVAFESGTGKEVWRQERPTDAPRESPDAYTTPALLTVNGKPQIVVSGGDYVTGHDPATGEELWRAAGLNPQKAPNYRIVNSPVIADGMIYAGSRQRPLLALKAGGKGDVTTSNLAWKWEATGGPDVPTPVSDGKYFYMVADNPGLLTCIDAKTGEKIYGPERLNVGATVSSSPLLADGKLYITGENAVTVVFAAGPEFKPLATNDLDGTFTLSSIAVSGQQLFLRTSTHLYCIGTENNR
jgi:outer membrane protein assembly factor BamB